MNASAPATPAKTFIIDSDSIERWQQRRYASGWPLFNLVTTTLAVAVAWHAVQHHALVAWQLFICVNTLIFAAHSRSAAAVNGDRSALRAGFALIFGLGWGVGVALAASHVEPAALLTLAAIATLTTLFAIPVFASSLLEMPLYLAGIAVPLSWALFTTLTPPLAALWLVCAVGLPWCAWLLYHRTSGAFAGMLSGFLTALDDVALFPDPALARELGFKRFAQRHLRCLQHALADYKRNTAMLNALGEGLIRTDQHGIVEYMNPVAETLTGMNVLLARGQHITKVVSLHAPGEPALLDRLLRRCLETGQPQTAIEQAVLARLDGAEYDIECAVSPLPALHTASAGLICQVRDVTERRHLTRTLAWRAAHDPLTNLINRAEFETRIKQLLDGVGFENVSRHAVCIIDIDDFSAVNDIYGSAAGDCVLQTLAQTLRQQIRNADTLARVGADEFGIVLYGCAIDKAKALAERILHTVEAVTTHWHGAGIKITISIGLVEISPASTSLLDVLSGSDSACVSAKREGGNRIHVHRLDENYVRNRDRALARVKQIQTALDNGGLELFFQPVHAIRGTEENLRHCELLVRMTTQDGGLLAPRDVVSASASHHLLTQIDRWAVTAAVAALERGDPALADMDIVAINIASHAVTDSEFLEYLVALLSERPAVAERICFEIAEGDLLTSADQACYFIAAVKMLGCQVALDEFGLGVNSFHLLKKLHVDYLKIGGEFVQNMGYNSVDYEIVLGIARIAKSLRIKTIAAGVSTLATRDALLGMGVDFAQGPLVDTPQRVAASGGH